MVHAFQYQECLVHVSYIAMIATSTGVQVVCMPSMNIRAIHDAGDCIAGRYLTCSKWHYMLQGAAFSHQRNMPLEDLAHFSVPQ
jgi:hypothetical protein